MITFYKPTKAGTGSACSFYLSQDGNIMTSLLRQAGHSASGKASFAKNRGSTENNIVIKLTGIEASGLIHSINTSEDWKGFHRTAEKSSSIRFGLYRDRETGDPKGGFTFGILCTFHKQNDKKASILIGLSETEVVYLKAFLVYCMNKQFELNAYKPKGDSKKVPQKKAKPPTEDDWSDWDDTKSSNKPSDKPSDKGSESELSNEEAEDLW